MGVSSGSAFDGDDNPSESILEALNETGNSKDCDNKGYDFDDYDVIIKQFEAELAREELGKKQAATKQVFLASKGDDGGYAAADLPTPAAKDVQASGAQDIPPPTTSAANDDPPVIHGGPMPSQPTILEDRPAKDFITPADKVMYGTLADPITLSTLRMFPTSKRSGVTSSRRLR
jgi:hypothetical protein